MTARHPEDGAAACERPGPGSIYRKDAETGGLLLFPPPRNEVSFTASLRRRTVPTAQHLTDLAWYLQEMLPALLPLRLTAYTAQDLAD